MSYRYQRSPPTRSDHCGFHSGTRNPMDKTDACLLSCFSRYSRMPESDSAKAYTITNVALVMSVAMMSAWITSIRWASWARWTFCLARSTNVGSNSIPSALQLYRWTPEMSHRPSPQPRSTRRSADVKRRCWVSRNVQTAWMIASGDGLYGANSGFSFESVSAPEARALAACSSNARMRARRCVRSVCETVGSILL